MSPKGLSAIQRRLLEGFRDGEGYWLTGGAALGGFHLHHRRSHDLDFFTADVGVIDELRRRLERFCADQSLELRAIQTYPGFRRFEVCGPEASTLVDLVHEVAPQVVGIQDKPLLEGLRVDPPRELRANKLGALLGRAETKDLVDLYALDQAGWPPLEGLEDGATKDAGLDAATLGWVLDSLRIDLTGLILETPIEAAALEAFRAGLVRDLQNRSFPSEE